MGHPRESTPRHSTPRRVRFRWPRAQPCFPSTRSLRGQTRTLTRSHDFLLFTGSAESLTCTHVLNTHEMPVPPHEQISAWTFVYVKCGSRFFFFFKSTALIATQEELGVSSAFGSSQGVWVCGGKYLDLLIEGSPRKRSWRRDDSSLSNKMNPPQSTGPRKKFCGQNSAPKAVPGRPLCSSPAHGLGSPPQSLKSGCSHSPTDPQK